MERTYTVMLVEDERNILYGMKNAILCYKPQVSDIMTAENGREALELLEERVPDIIITDIRMPEVDGSELVRRIREQGYEMPVIILTAMTDFAIARDLIHYQIQNYIVKPFSIEEILKETELAIGELKKRSQMKMAQKIVKEFPELVETPPSSENQLISQAVEYISSHLDGGETMERTYTVMLVEDERNILYGMKNAILCYKPQVSDIMTAENGREALELLEERVPDIIITDIRMPEVDGSELVRRIREQGYEMPVIILTAMTDFAIARDLIHYQIQNYIVKPFSIEEILKETELAIGELKKRSQMKMAQKIVKEFPELVETPPSSENQLISQAVEYISSHLDGAASLNDISGALHVSKAYLSTLFKREMNTTVTDFVTKQRMKEAKKLLLETDMLVSEIYLKVGYQSDKYFIKVFKEMEGVTPLAYRKRWK